MKKIILGLLVLTTTSIYAQEKIKEPNFAGEAFIINADESIIDLDKEKYQLKTRLGLSAYLTPFGKGTTKIEVAGCCSGASVSSDGDLKLVVRAINNESEPLSIIQVFKFKKHKKKNKRIAVLVSFDTISAGLTSSLEYLQFNAERYGEKSYLLTIKKYEKGTEYGVMVDIPNTQLGQKILSTFGIK